MKDSIPSCNNFIYGPLVFVTCRGFERKGEDFCIPPLKRVVGSDCVSTSQGREVANKGPQKEVICIIGKIGGRPVFYTILFILCYGYVTVSSESSECWIPDDQEQRDG